MDFYEFLGGQNSEETRRAYETDLKQYAEFSGGDFSRYKIMTFRDALVASGLAPSTVVRKLASLKSYCKFLQSQGKLTVDVFAGIKIPKSSVAEPTQAFTDIEVRKILKAAENNKRDKLILSLLFFAGLRRSELSALKINNIKEVDGILVLQVYGKGGKYRQIPAHPKLEEVLRPELEIRKVGFLVDVGTSSIYWIVKKYALRVGVTRNVSPHSCRATAISQLLENGESPRNVADFAGHSSINTTISSYDKKRDGIKNSSAMKLNF